MAVAIANDPKLFREEKSKQPNPAREFSVVRKRRHDQATPPTTEARAAYFVKGKTPLHIRLAAFDEFDGRRWIEPAITAKESSGLGLGFGGWIILPEFQPSVVAGDLAHKIVVASIDAPQLPLPPYTHGFRIDRVDRPDFFRFSQPGILIYRINTGLPRQTVLDVGSHTIDPALLRNVRFPLGCIYAHPKSLGWRERTSESDADPPRDVSTQRDSRIARLASSWVQGTGRGWRQVEAVVSRLQGVRV